MKSSARNYSEQQRSSPVKGITSAGRYAKGRFKEKGFLRVRFEQLTNSKDKWGD
tara:strand:- start:597 stop:758 length:162 start_codon:yes stop_codon:yes gene_type:complete